MQSQISEYYEYINADHRSLCVSRDLSAYYESVSFYNKTWGVMPTEDLEFPCCTCGASTIPNSYGSMSTHAPLYPTPLSPPCCGVSVFEILSLMSPVVSYVTGRFSSVPRGSQCHHCSKLQMLICSLLKQDCTVSAERLQMLYWPTPNPEPQIQTLTDQAGNILYVQL